MPLNDSCLKRDSLELGNLSRDVSECGGKLSVAMTAAMVLTLLVSLLPRGLSQLLCFGLHQFIEGFLEHLFSLMQFIATCCDKLLDKDMLWKI